VRAFYADHFVLPLPPGHRFPKSDLDNGDLDDSDLDDSDLDDSDLDD